MNKSKLYKLAKEMTNKSHSPYNHFLVGAVLVTSDGKLYTGCSVDNQGILSICAERVAFVKTISEGKNQPKDFKYIIMAGRKDNSKEFIKTLPCGYCRQFMSEFVNPDFKIYYYDNGIHFLTMKDLLPYNFDL